MSLALSKVMVTRVMQLADGEELISFDVERARSTVLDDPRSGALERRRLLEVTVDQLAGMRQARDLR